MIKAFKQNIMKQFEMIDLGMMNYFIGMEINQTDERIFICQKKYTINILKKFKMENSKPISIPLTQNDKFTKEYDFGEADMK